MAAGRAVGDPGLAEDVGDVDPDGLEAQEDLGVLPAGDHAGASPFSR
jgi:hypothetical protein